MAGETASWELVLGVAGALRITTIVEGQWCEKCTNKPESSSLITIRKCAVST